MTQLLSKSINQIVLDARIFFDKNPRLANLCLICSFGLLGIQFRDEVGFVCTNEGCRLMYSSKGYPLGIFKGASLALGLPKIEPTQGNFDNYQAKVSLSVNERRINAFDDPTRTLMAIAKEKPICEHLDSCQGWLIIKLDDKFIPKGSGFGLEVDNIEANIESLLDKHDYSYFEANSFDLVKHDGTEKYQMAYMLVGALDLSGTDFSKTLEVKEKLEALDYQVMTCSELEAYNPLLKQVVSQSRNKFLRQYAAERILRGIFD